MRNPELGQRALAGLRRYQESAPPPPRAQRPVLASVGGASLRDCGGEGATLILVPSLINPPDILDLDPDCSLAEALAARHRVLLLDWGPAAARAQLDLVGHVEALLLPLLANAGPATLVGYCLGGTLSLAAAARDELAAAVVTLASPWRFDAYPDEATDVLARLWRESLPVARQLGFLPMELLQTAFWQIDPERIVTKFARFADAAQGSTEARRFVALEDWANGGEALPLPAARALVEDLFVARKAGLGPLPACPALHVTARGDRIVPAATRAPGEGIDLPAGHVGMVVGRDAARLLHRPLLQWLEGPGRPR
ncbi:alpha/beta fold hydrolase [Sphingomonas astaxanthinifaciens]|uniref:alpha/beta fold hydrolase n=1 Tax=Sphingomonas astaxanthinifaciens TaxID=407019 RepID=UPI00068ED2B5|nr:alpha/beta fold hydrolase [Sphingomonas astaxanthinifaciens]